MKKLAIIGANDFQRQLILKAKEMGLETHVFAWEEGAVGKADADYFYPISDWYPFIGTMFDEENRVKYKNVLKNEDCIYNLPLDNSDIVKNFLSDINFKEVFND